MKSWSRTLLVTTMVASSLLSLTVRASAYDTGTPSIITKNPTYGRLYVVQDGDTLWDIAEIFFYEPWYWPTLWSYNPQITNPHWIYPGDLLQLQAPPRPGQTSTIVWSDSRYTKRKVDLEVLARYVGYLPDRQFKESGQIAHARESHDTLAEYDEVYIEFGEDTNVKVGERFTIYRYEGELEHPDGDWENAEGDDLVGHKIRHLGIAKVLNADKKFVKALILKSYEEITRGDLVTTIFPHSWLVAPVTNDVELEATLVDYHMPTIFVGGLMYVYIDKGRNDGLRRGNRFLIQRRGDGLWIEDGDVDEDDAEDFPWENLGEVMVVEAFEQTSLGVVTRSISELSRGERLFMKAGY